MKKCEFLNNTITYLDQIVDGKGVRSFQDKTEPIMHQGAPSNKKQ